MGVHASQTRRSLSGLPSRRIRMAGAWFVFSLCLALGKNVAESRVLEEGEGWWPSQGKRA